MQDLENKLNDMTTPGLERLSGLKIGAFAKFPHHVEHLIPVCDLLGIPMITVGRESELVARECYPFQNVVRIDTAGDSIHEGFEPALLSELAHYDVILYSHLFPRELLRDVLGRLRNPPPRVVFCPHGFSEKQSRWSAAAAYQDTSIFYGQFGLDQLVMWGVSDMLQRFAVVGNLRLEYFRTHAVFFSQLLRMRGITRNGAQTVILYAPTWSDTVGSSSFFQAAHSLIKGLPNDWTLLIKPHPLLEREINDDILASIRKRGNVSLLMNMPLTYPVLDMVDVYVGDMSSLAYDFLMYDRPTVFLNQTAGKVTDPFASELFRCGPVISPDRYDGLIDVIREAMEYNGEWSDVRRKLYGRVYSEARSPELLREELFSLFRLPPPAWMYPSSSFAR